VQVTAAVRFGPYCLDPSQGLRRGKNEVRLTPKALAVLRVLAARPGQVITKDELFRLAWPDTIVSDAALASCIQELRRALRDDARQPRYIETMHRRGYRFLMGPPASAPAALAASAWMGSAPAIFGREPELERMRSCLDRARAGSRQTVFVSGEPGIGKTTLVEAFLARAVEVAPLRVAWGQCVEHYGSGEAYQPLLEGLTRIGQGAAGEAVVAALGRCAPTWLAQLPSLVGSTQLAALQRRTAGATKERMLRELTDALETIALDVPLVLFLEDLHWSDVSTLDWIASFARRPEKTPVMLIGTYRPAQPLDAGHPLRGLAHELLVHQACVEIALDCLGRDAVSAFVTARFPSSSGAAPAVRQLAYAIHRHTEGNPLFVAAVLSDLQARGLLLERGGTWEPKDAAEIRLEIPEDVRRLIERQLERLPADLRRLLEVASVAGAEFAAAAVAAGASVGVGEVEAGLGELARREQLVRAAGTEEWPDGTVSARFAFRHALYREVAYDRISPSRRAELHRTVGAREETGYGPRAQEIAAELAMHFERGRESARAVSYLQQASAAAARRGAYSEALMHLQRALALLKTVPPARARDEQEVALRIALGGLLMATGGWGAAGVQEAYARARELCGRLGDTPQLFPALWGPWLYYWGRGELASARELADRLLGLAQGASDGDLLLQAHHAQWATAFALGEPAAADAHAARGIALYEAERHGRLAETYGGHDAGACARWFRGCALALLGRVDEAVRVGDEAIALARKLEHPFSLGLALFFAAMVHQARRDPLAARTHAEAAVVIARDQGVRLLLAWATTLAGWAMAAQGDRVGGMTRMRAGLADAQATGSPQFRSHMLGLLAEAHLAAGAHAEGLQFVDEALAIVARTGEAFYEAELHRLRAELLEGVSDVHPLPEAEAVLQQAIDVARRQGTALLGLRATVSLARRWRSQGRNAEAHALVADALATLPEQPPLADRDEAAVSGSG
jgi:predicted ATPase